MNHSYPYINSNTPPVLPFAPSQFKFTSYNLYHNPNPMAQSIQDHSPRMAQSQIIDPSYGNAIQRNAKNGQREHIRQSITGTVNKSPFKDIEESQDIGDNGRNVGNSNQGRQEQVMQSGDNSLDIHQGPYNGNHINNQLQQAYGHSQQQQQDSRQQDRQFRTAQKPVVQPFYHTTQKPSQTKQQFHFQLTQQSLSSHYHLRQAQQSTAQVDHVLEFVHDEDRQRDLKTQTTEMQTTSKVKNSGDVLNEEISEVKYRLDQLMRRYPVGRGQGGGITNSRSSSGRNDDNRGNSVNHTSNQQTSSKINTQTQPFIKKPLNGITPIIDSAISNPIHTSPNLNTNLNVHPTAMPNPNPRPQTPPPTTFLNMRRSKSINESPLNMPSPPQKSYHPRTQAKIMIPHTQQQPSINYNNNVPKGLNSLNYSESIKNYQELQEGSNYNGLQWRVYQQGNGNGNGNQMMHGNGNQMIHGNDRVIIPQANPHEELLYRQIHEQEQLIREYKGIILKLEHQNHSLKSSQPPIPTHNTQPNLSTQFNKLELEQSLTHTLQQPQLEQTQKRPSGMNSNRVRVSGKIKLSLEQQVEILQEEKKELINKIEWLNGVVEQMMNMGNNVGGNQGSGSISVVNSNDVNNNTNTTNNYNNTSNNNISSNNNNTSNKKQTLHSRHNSNLHSRQPSTQLLSRQQKLTQTSFIIQNHSNYNNSNTPTLKQQQLLYYKSLYQQQLQQYNVLRQQFNQILQVQDQYNRQFQLILKEIKQIKKGREYYQKMKREIKRRESKQKQSESQQRAEVLMLSQQKKRDSKQRGIDVRQGSRGRQYHNREYHNRGHHGDDESNSNMSHNNTRYSPNQPIFQNRVIYQLKQQNTQLLQQNRKLKLLYTKHQAHLNSLQLSTNPNNNPTHQDNRNNSKTFQSNLSNCSQSRSQSLDETMSHMKKHRKQQHGRNLVEDSMKKRSVSYREDVEGVDNNINNGDKRFRKVKQYWVCQLGNGQYGNQVGNSQHLNHLSSVSSPMEYDNNRMQYNNPLKQYDVKQSRKQKTLHNDLRHNTHNRLQDSNHSQSLQSSVNHSNATSNLAIIDRYNNFIKNLKKKFSITSSIVGKEISVQQVIFHNNR